MLNVLIEEIEEFVAEKICNPNDRDPDSVSVGVADLLRLTQAAKLLCDIHEMADSGELDGVDLEWMVKADSLVLGKDSQ